jgi:hypothetical protein
VQGLLALEPADLRALLGIAIHLTVGGVQVDKHHLVRTGQQIDLLGKPDQAFPQHLVQLLDMPVGERAQERPERGGRPHPGEHAAVPGMP